MSEFLAVKVTRCPPLPHHPPSGENPDRHCIINEKKEKYYTK